MSHQISPQIKAMRKVRREELVEDMRDGRVLRASTFKSKKGKGSYRRKNKYGKEI